ncbi:glycosyltransferase [Paenibacillus aurantius]|uniref:Glycosyltransferase n=1 Tax=Paenibacillus aurantius TaxID=2918900 RepID=A0AA96LC72_9BACL|nr:glycosyltransferase [Paenibacillus aurantius]WNQ10429.1 glycosyltransferase [Paenibacillus aurantius]
MQKNTKNGLSVVICTRNRQKDLQKCIDSLAEQKIDDISVPIEIIIIDDGNLTEETIDQFESQLSPRFSFRYHQKSDPGLIFSRVESIKLASYEIMLFIDDDIELFPNYLSTLYKTYLKNPDVVGVGGVDQFINSRRKWKFFGMIIGYHSGNCGKLSKSGYGGSMQEWIKIKEAFQTEYLSGCNMSFLKGTLAGLKPTEWLTSYSLGEDLYLSLYANKRGPLLINPDLKVLHHQSQASRDKVETVAYTEVVNHYHLLNYTDNNFSRKIYQLYTASGLFLKSLIQRKHRNKAKGYFKGILYVARNLYKT